MVLSTHAVIGGVSAALITGSPVTAFMVGFVGHFIVDVLPHWHYPLHSLSKNEDDHLKDDMVLDRRFLKDLFNITVDVSLGFLIIALLAYTAPTLLWVLFFGATGAVVPDALQFLYFKWRHEPLVSLQRFHLWSHVKTTLDDRNVLGPALQVGLVLLCLLLFCLYH